MVYLSVMNFVSVNINLYIVFAQSTTIVIIYFNIGFRYLYVVYGLCVAYRK